MFICDVRHNFIFELWRVGGRVGLSSLIDVLEWRVGLTVRAAFVGVWICVRSLSATAQVFCLQFHMLFYHTCFDAIGNKYVCIIIIAPWGRQVYKSHCVLVC